MHIFHVIDNKQVFLLFHGLFLRGHPHPGCANIHLDSCNSLELPAKRSSFLALPFQGNGELFIFSAAGL